ncbi:succinate dehydrogenase [Paracoccus suum]|uniref:Succinate dehydrogenase n=1 Tax=Paracoccus suum TaxID=2259340 RepID=A0A344PKH0_9RHOB|nr:succinate dehydrogenase [Paracoccus suum]AXC49875.1 succinate dehydrogenase [Paracoccus suum]
MSERKNDAALPTQHFYTPRKAAEGLGSARSGTAAHWAMTVSAVALAILTPLVIGLTGSAIGLEQPDVIGLIGRPGPAILLGLFIVVGMIHWIRGTRILIDDYMRGLARTWTLIAVQIVGWAVMAAGIYALARMALIGIVV